MSEPSTNAVVSTDNPVKVDKHDTIQVQEADLVTRTVDHDSEKPKSAQYKVKLVGYKSRKRSAQGLDLMQSLESSVINKSGHHEAHNSMTGGIQNPKIMTKTPNPVSLKVIKKQITQPSMHDNNLVRDIMSSEFDKQMNEIQGNVRKLYSH